MKIDNANLAFIDHENGILLRMPPDSSVYLSQNKLRKVPPIVRNGSSLKLLDLNDNPITSLTGRFDVVTLYVERCGLRHVNVTSRVLKKLFLSGCNIPELKRKHMAVDDGLELLYLGRCGIQKIEANFFQAFSTNLREIGLSRNNLTTIATNIFNDLPKLTLVNLESNKIHTLEIGAFSNLPVLPGLSLVG